MSEPVAGLTELGVATQLTGQSLNAKLTGQGLNAILTGVTADLTGVTAELTGVTAELTGVTAELTGITTDSAEAGMLLLRGRETGLAVGLGLVVHAGGLVVETTKTGRRADSRSRSAALRCLSLGVARRSAELSATGVARLHVRGRSGQLLF